MRDYTITQSTQSCTNHVHVKVLRRTSLLLVLQALFEETRTYKKIVKYSVKHAAAAGDGVECWSRNT